MPITTDRYYVTDSIVQSRTLQQSNMTIVALKNQCKDVY